MNMTTYGTNLRPKLERLTDICVSNGQIDPSLYGKYEVKRGLRDLNGKGVLTGLTDISEIRASKTVDGVSVPCEGRLFYRGIDVKDIIKGFISEKRFGFEEVSYLLIFGVLPTAQELKNFKEVLNELMTLPTNFIRDVIMKGPSDDMMNSLARSVLTLHSYDDNANDTSLPNVLRQCLKLIALFPMLSVYGYQAYNFYIEKQSLFIHQPNPNLSTAENILHLLRPDSSYTELEAHVLDIALVLHAEHGGGNNSTFTTHVVSSTGTDTYSAVAASLGSLKGPKHGGANLKVQEMFRDIKAHVSDWEDEEALRSYLVHILRKEAFDKAGLIYGIGHAVYTESDPRAVILKEYARKLSEEKGLTREFELYERVERIGGECLMSGRKLLKPVCANVDFYSGFVYSMLGLPAELFTPIFAISRISGWSAHRIEELANAGKIVRPAYKYVGHHVDYEELEERK